jgi:uncharacterized membrane protein YkvA (DUF1232 family)
LRPIERLKLWASRLKAEVYALYLAYRDPRTPWHAKVVVAVVVGYAASPIDLIPDPIPIFGYLDDVILIPLGVALVVRCIPPEVLSECRSRVDKQGVPPPNRIAAFVIVGIWLSVFAGALAFLV